MKKNTKKENIQIAEMIEGYVKEKRTEIEIKKADFKQSLDKFLKVNSEIIISLIPFLLFLNYSSNMKYGFSSSTSWVILIVLLVFVLLAYYFNSINNIKNTFLEIISLILLIITFSLYLFIGWDISKDNICISAETNGNTEINENCKKLRSEWINRNSK